MNAIDLTLGVLAFVLVVAISFGCGYIAREAQERRDDQ